jgi:hypothetical protein
MKNALGRWSAQYQQEAPVSRFSKIMDPPESVLPDGAQSAPGFVTESEPEAAAPPEPASAPEAAPQPEPFVSNGTYNGTHNGTHNGTGTGGTFHAARAEDRQETAGEPKDEASAHGPRPEEQQQEQDRGHGYEHFEPKPPSITDYYEVLQISRNADPETIHRVYRIMVARFHPDNPRTGDPERFQLLRRAYHVLSDPGRRAEYDRTYTWAETHTLPIFELKEFVDGIDGEKNRRLGILSLLYHRRRLNEQKPGISVLDLEQRMGFPREYLNFTLWYLKAKGFVRFEENSDYGLTVEGVDYLEANSVQNTIIRELLEAGTMGETATAARAS